MLKNLNNNYQLISPNQVNDFINSNERTIEIINAMEPPLNSFFPEAELSLKVCDKLNWTSETKLLLNVRVGEEMFFNGLLDHFNEIYAEIEPLIEDILCPVVLFPEIKNKSFDKFTDNSAINLIARTAYFNNDYDGSIECEINLRDIPREQQKEEIINYCKTHDDIWAPDIVDELLLDYDDVYEILEELEKEGKIIEIE
ncbi:hypothetical protein [uncultured Methanobrevibacter sp.]|uniref:hypothetical protein n=1 Tax=uncultured Methanobrevibacter sp. TaxID=253161 RepID=UPI0026313D42|nr:hypothetical protein [uncultured Methanobrevibacter sp.]